MLSRSGMLSKQLVRQAPALAGAPVRGMASEQQLKARIKSVGNIGKITKAMKMVSAAKLRRSQINLENARSFTADMNAIWPDPKPEENPSKYLVVGCASDKGLCGAINSSIIRNIRDKLNAQENKDLEKGVILFGEKARMGLERLYKQHFVVTYSDIAKWRDRSFDQAALCADELLKQDFDKGELVYNYFKSLLAYETTTVPIFSFKQSIKNKSALKYKIVGGRSADVLQSLYEFRTATRLFGWLAEGDTSELSARMNAMGNSSKNAGEMLDSLTLLYNRKRQSKITTELIEIISGASAAEEQVS